MMGRFGLLGRHLDHSYSPAIHGYFGSVPYDLYEKEPEELEAFVLGSDWDGLNVTMPYKKSVTAFCRELSPLAKELRSVNTLIRLADGSIYGDNTDAHGFQQMALRLDIDYRGKKALVLGSGGASVTVQAVLATLGCTVTVISRAGENNYHNLSQHSDAAILVNATPVGMYPKTGESPLSLDEMPKLEAVLDLVYNPARTALIMAAEERGIPCISGLYMLVAQAARASAQFTGKAISPDMVDRVWTRLALDTENLALIGMPGCGKSTVGRLLAQRMGRTFVDVDEEIEKSLGIPVSDYIQQAGEEPFRAVETRILQRLGAMSGAIIATGGGCVTKSRNYPLLHQNSRIIWLRRNLELLPDTGRPLSQAMGLDALYAVREPLYQSFAEIQVWNNGSPEETVRTILEAIKT